MVIVNKNVKQENHQRLRKSFVWPTKYFCQRLDRFSTWNVFFSISIRTKFIMKICSRLFNEKSLWVPVRGSQRCVIFVEVLVVGRFKARFYFVSKLFNFTVRCICNFQGICKFLYIVVIFFIFSVKTMYFGRLLLWFWCQDDVWLFI